MRILHICIVACLIMMSASPAAEAVIKNSLIGSIGLPRGAMDYSANAALKITIDLPTAIDPEFRVAGSFATKSNAGSRATMMIGSVYCLGKIALFDHLPKVSPYVAAGPGLHFIYSTSSASGNAVEFYDSSNFVTLLKSHVFVGFDLAMTPKIFISAETRATLPSDSVIDSGYLGIGLRF